MLCITTRPIFYHKQLCPGRLAVGQNQRQCERGLAGDNRDKNSNVFASGEFYYLGTPASFGSITLPIPLGGEQSLWVKYRPDGSVAWAGGTNYTFARILNLATDTAGNLILFGDFNGDSVRFSSLTLYNTSGSPNQFFIVKLNAAGSV